MHCFIFKEQFQLLHTVTFFGTTLVKSCTANMLETCLNEPGNQGLKKPLLRKYWHPSTTQNVSYVFWRHFHYVVHPSLVFICPFIGRAERLQKYRLIPILLEVVYWSQFIMWHYGWFCLLTEAYTSSVILPLSNFMSWCVLWSVQSILDECSVNNASSLLPCVSCVFRMA